MPQRAKPKRANQSVAAEPAADREVIRCQACGLVQFRTRTGNCRRCLRPLPPPFELRVQPVGEPPGATSAPVVESWANREIVERIGLRIRHLREARGLTQSQLQERSGVSRSYLSRIESGQMTPSLGTLEKIAEALGLGLNRFFMSATRTEALLEDPFIQSVRPYLRQLDRQQWQAILKRLQMIQEHLRRPPVPALRPRLFAPASSSSRRTTLSPVQR